MHLYYKANLPNFVYLKTMCVYLANKLVELSWGKLDLTSLAVSGQRLVKWLENKDV